MKSLFFRMRLVHWVGVVLLLVNASGLIEKSAGLVQKTAGVSVGVQGSIQGIVGQIRQISDYSRSNAVNVDEIVVIAGRMHEMTQGVNLKLKQFHT